jgi:methylated-DNA-[protein]-cysteine S-methyltransferase
VRFTFIDSPIGPLLAAKDADDALTELHFAGATPDAGWQRDDDAFADLAAQLREYFAGKLRTFTLALAPRGTPFQMSVWSALQTIPYGETRSYAEIARTIARPNAIRAVGAANGANPIPIVIPCHRVIGSSGALTGFGGGLETKRRLLALEGSGGMQLFP